MVSSEQARLSHLFVTVGDVEAAREFWTETIGLDLLVEEEGYLRVGGAGGFSMGIERADDQVPAVEVVVRVAEVDTTFARLQAAGIDCDSPPRDMPWGARHIWLRDPDGRAVSIYSSAQANAK
jgi:catechol 2,3-dioxygenase-like lactoylglutathione lyase family enzyme